MKQIIEIAVQREINQMDHEPDTAFAGIEAHPKINWANVHERVYDLVQDHVVTEGMDDMVEDVIEKAIEQVIDANWVENALHDARADWHEQQERNARPYRYNGIFKPNLI